MDTTDLRGIPKMDGEMLESMPPMWILYFTQEEADGLIFFDEINLATPIVVGSAYQIIHDRSIADRKISDNILMIAAGNRAEDKAFTFDLPLPLRDRFCEAELLPDVKSWTTWASEAKINPHIISFVNWKEEYLYRVDELGKVKSVTPRGLQRASRLLGDMEITSAKARFYIALAVGDAFATEFQAYIRYFAELDWEVIFNNPSSVRSFSVSKRFAVSGGLAELFTKDKNNFERICKVIEEFSDDFAIRTLILMRDSSKTSFKRRAETSNIFVNKLAPKFGKYIINKDTKK
jgi:hypothetical protein